jgi:hypothetical protein
MKRLVAGALLLLCVDVAFAEDQKILPSPSESSASTPSSNPTMQPPSVGDHWTYEVKDDISNALMQTRTVVITDLSKGTIATRFDVLKTGQFGTILYDPSWNIVTDSVWKYSPNDGTGVQLPLAPGTRWKFLNDATNSTNGTTWKRVGHAQVTGQEFVTTKAGKFDTSIIETTFSMQSTKDPSRKSDTTIRTWFSTDIDHWVKRNTTVRENGRLFQNITIELTEYGRKQ